MVTEVWYLDSLLTWYRFSTSYWKSTISEDHIVLFISYAHLSRQGRPFDIQYLTGTFWSDMVANGISLFRFVIPDRV